MSLRVIVVGAGIAGITAAVSLHQGGHKVKIYEKSKFTTEIGAALNCAPNGALALQKLGFDFTQAKGVRLDNWESVDGYSLDQIRDQDLSQADKSMGAPFCALHRNDLLQGLLALSRLSDTTAGGETRSIKLVLNAKVVHVDVARCVISLADGTEEEADLIVASDGIHSTIRPAIVDSAVNTSTDTGLSAFRFLMPKTVLLESPAGLRLLARKRNGVTLYVDTVNLDEEKHIACYACKGGELYNFVCIHSAKKNTGELDDPKNELLQEFGDFHSDIVEVLRLASDVQSWPLLARLPLISWSKGNVVLIGDAAHPMLPFGGQGANQAIEDGAALGVFLRGIDAVSLQERLQAYVKFRYRRVARTQLLGSARPGKEHEVVKNVREFMEIGVELPDSFPKRVLHDAAYDVVMEAERAVASTEAQ